ARDAGRGGPCRVFSCRRGSARGIDLGRAGRRQQGEDEESRPRRNQAPARLSRNSVNTRTAIPVGPFAWLADSPSRYAVPAISRCTHGKLSTNSRRNQAPAIVPAERPPEILTSATSDLSSSRYFSTNGSGQQRSPARSPASRT